MISIYRSTYDSTLNVFHGKDFLSIKDVRIEHNANGVQGNTVAYPKGKGAYAFGGTFLYTCNGIFPDFCKRPVPLHDRDMSLEDQF